MQIILAFNTDIIVIHNYMLFRHSIGFIVAKCPSLAGTVPEFGPMSRFT